MLIFLFAFLREKIARIELIATVIAIVGVVAYLIARYVADVAMRQQQPAARGERFVRRRQGSPCLGY